jgi:osmotically-inducible protein OsmY
MTNQSSDSKNYPSPGDLAIKKNIEKELSGPHLWDTTDIHPEVSEGVVTLTGTVIDKEASQKSAALVATIAGVTSVINRLEIKGRGIASVLSEIAAEVSKVTTDEHTDHKKDE